MGSSGDLRTTAMFVDHFSDSDSSTSSTGNKVNGDDAEQLHILENTFHFDNTIVFEEEFATQVMDTDGETQAVNLGGETQMVNLGGETQVVNFGDKFLDVHGLDSVQSSGTQLFDDCDTEEISSNIDDGTDMTEVLDDIHELSDDDSGKRDCTGLAKPENTEHVYLSKLDSDEHKSKLDCGTSEQHSSGSQLKGFTSIRAASVRASGLAARTRASPGSQSQSCYTSSSTALETRDIGPKGILSERSPSNVLEGVPGSPAEGKCNVQINGQETGNRCRFGRPTARKLFADDVLTETKEANDEVNVSGGADLPTFLHSESELAGLSYIDSQEPGEASQANALDFVDNFLKVSVVSDDAIDIRKSTGGKMKSVLSAKGTQSLARSANLINTVGERGIYDWDDKREDEGGGEFFRKKKEAFFDSGCRRRKSFSYSKSRSKVGEPREGKRLHNHEKVRGLCSDSKLASNRTTSDKSRNIIVTGIKEAKFRKNLIKELDEQSNLGFEHEMIEKPSETDMQEATEILFNTQMAAEAMESLCFGAHRTDHEANKADGECNHVQEKSHRRRSQERTRYDVGVSTRKIKSTDNQCKEMTAGLSKHSVKMKKKCDHVPVKGQKWVKSAGNKNTANNEGEDLNNASSDYVKNRREERSRSLKRMEVDATDGCPPTASTEEKSVKKPRIQGKHGTFTPISCRTRQSVKHNESEKVKDASSDFREEMINLTGNYPRGKRTCRKLSSVGQEVSGQSISRLTRSEAALSNTPPDLSTKRKTRSSLGKNPLPMESHGSLLQQGEQGKRSGDINLSLIHRNEICQADSLSSSEVAKASGRLEGSLREQCKPNASACATPVNSVTPVKEASPICMGDEYLKQSCRRKSSYAQEVCNLGPTGAELISPTKDTRKRRDMSMIRVLFSRHLDGYMVKQQRKVLSRLGASVASSMSDATHFIADEFVRTRNMLEAISFGKPVVTHLWLESCGQACCHIDEKNYILRDGKKEKEFGFSLPASLASARQNPLLQGRRVLITPNTKPGTEILVSLVKAVQGLAFERIGRSALKDDKLPAELLILSCEEDFAVCVPFLEKGAAVYSSELLLNGIVTQKLEYERHRLFLDHVKRTRSTIFLKKDDNQYRPVSKCK